MNVRTMASIIADYVTSIGKKPEELKEARIVSAPDKSNSPISWDVELVFGNQYVTYTRVARFWLNEHIQYKSITQKTRLWVPAGEVPEGATFYLGWHGPFTKVTMPNGEVWGMRPHRNTPMEDDRLVECEFYYAKGEGTMAGGNLWVREADLLEKFGQESLERMVNGCKFDFWAVCHEMATGRRSKFS